MYCRIRFKVTEFLGFLELRFIKIEMWRAGLFFFTSCVKSNNIFLCKKKRYPLLEAINLPLSAEKVNLKKNKQLVRRIIFEIDFTKRHKIKHFLIQKDNTFLYNCKKTTFSHHYRWPRFSFSTWKKITRKKQEPTWHVDTGAWMSPLLTVIAKANFITIGMFECHALAVTLVV